MKRYQPTIGKMNQWASGDYYLVDEVDAIIAEKDKEIAGLNRRVWAMEHDFAPLNQFHRKYALGPMLPPSCLVCGVQTVPALLDMPQSMAIQHAELPGIVVCKDCANAAGTKEQLRASNETLVAAQARISALLFYVKFVNPEHGLISMSDLTALAEHDKEVRAKALEDAAVLFRSSGTIDEYAAIKIIEMATELRAKKE